MCLTELADPEDWQDCSALMALVNHHSATPTSTGATSAATGATKKAGDKSISPSSSSSSSLSSLSVYGLHHGDIVQCRVLSTATTLPTKDKGSDKDQGKDKDKEKYHKEKMQFVNVSLRPSRLTTDGGAAGGGGGGGGDSENASSSSSSSSSPVLEVGSLVSAFVANVSLAKGCFLRLPGGGTGQVDDDFVTDPSLPI